MLRRLFLIPALAIAGICTLTSSAKAQTVNFQGIVPNSCVWSNPVDGTLVYDPLIPNLLTSNGGPPASIDILCAGGGDVTVANPNENPSNPMTGLSVVAWVTDSGGTRIESPSGTGGTLSIAPNPTGIAVTLGVGMEANSGVSPLTPGGLANPYNFTVTLTATP